MALGVVLEPGNFLGHHTPAPRLELLNLFNCMELAHNPHSLFLRVLLLGLFKECFVLKELMNIAVNFPLRSIHAVATTI